MEVGATVTVISVVDLLEHTTITGEAVVVAQT